MQVVMSPSRITYAPAPAVSATPNVAVWRLYRPAVWLLAIAGVAAFAPGISQVDWRVLAALIVFGTVADLLAIRIQRGMRVSTAHFAAPFAVIADSVTGGILAAAGCLIGRLVFNRRDWNTFDLAVNVLSASICGVAWMVWQQTPNPHGAFGYLVVVCVFTMFRATLNYGWTLEARCRGVRIPKVNGPIGKLMLACALLFTPAVSLFLIQREDPLSWVLLVLPFVATQFLVRAFGRERDLNDSLEDANLSLTRSLVNALDARDPYSGGHSVAVAVYSRDIAVEIGLAPAKVERMYLAGLLHDVGKIAVPDAILSKPAALTDEEFEEIKKHSVAGEQILAPARQFKDILPAVRHHHERIDGQGYPDGLRDEEIPLEARIIAVADAYNAMTSQRPYRDAMEPELACRILKQNRGMQHDPYLVDALHRVLEDRDHDYAVAIGYEFGTAIELPRATQRPADTARPAAGESAEAA